MTASDFRGNEMLKMSSPDPLLHRHVSTIHSRGNLSAYAYQATAILASAYMPTPRMAESLILPPRLPVTSPAEPPAAR